MRLEVRGVRVVLRSREVLRNVSMEVDEGDLVALLGPNGSGKSTLLRTIFGILEPLDGVVLFDGRRLMFEERAKVLGYLPQETPEVGLTVLEVVLLGRTPHISGLKRVGSNDVAIAKAALREVGMLDFEDRRFSELSGGEKQKVLLARVFAQQPLVMLLDEPTAHLDLASQLEIMRLVKRKVERESSAIVAMHDVNLAAAFAEKIMMIKNGEIVYAGYVDEVLTPEAIRDVYGVEVIVKKHGGYVYVLPLPRRRAENGRVHVICGGGSGREIIYRLTQEGFVVSAGVLNALDSDWEAAMDVGCEVVDEAPFSEISDTAFERNLSVIEEADVVVLADLSVGRGNFKNLLAAEKAAEAGKLVVVDSTPFDLRNFAGEEAAELYKKLLKRAVVVKSNGEVVDAVRGLLGKR